jgi:ATP/maltotriose-dependent transcriptional regulator MalT
MLPVITAEARLRQGDYAGAEAASADAFSGQSPRLQRLAACVLAKAQLARGNAAAALDTVDRAFRTETSSGLESDIELLTLRAEARFATDDAAGARDAIREARALVLQIADDVGDPHLRESFLRRVEPCARAMALSDEWSQVG